MNNVSLSPRAILGLVSIAAGAVLAIFFWELRVFWFQGGPLGIALIGLGGLDLWESSRRRRGGAPRGLLQRVRDELVGPPRSEAPPSEPTAGRSTEPEPPAGEEPGHRH